MCKIIIIIEALLIEKTTFKAKIIEDNSEPLDKHVFQFLMGLLL